MIIDIKLLTGLPLKKCLACAMALWNRNYVLTAYFLILYSGQNINCYQIRRHRLKAIQIKAMVSSDKHKNLRSTQYRTFRGTIDDVENNTNF